MIVTHPDASCNPKKERFKDEQQVNFNWYLLYLSVFKGIVASLQSQPAAEGEGGNLRSEEDHNEESGVGYLWHLPKGEKAIHNPLRLEIVKNWT